MIIVFILSLLLALAILCAAFLRDWRRTVSYWLRVYDQWERATFRGRERLRFRHYLEWSGRLAWVGVLLALWVMGLWQ